MSQTSEYGRTIDIHAHYLNEKIQPATKDCSDSVPHIVRDSGGREYISMNGRAPTPVAAQYGHIYDVERRIRDMDNSGVDVQVISAPPMYMGGSDPKSSIDVSMAQNEGIAETVKAFPDRFVGLATVPLHDPDAAAAELSRAMRQLHMKGVEIGTSVGGRNLDSIELWPFYRRAEELNAFILVHPINVQGAERMPRYHLSNLVGNPSATSLAIASLIFGGVLEKFPKLKICFAHGGGFAPYQRGRFEHGYEVRPECRENIPKPPSEYFKLLYFDTITHYGPALTYLIESVGSDHVLLGSDYPYDMADFRPVSSVESLKNISIAEKKKVLGENATKLLGL